MDPRNKCEDDEEVKCEDDGEQAITISLLPTFPCKRESSRFGIFQS